MITSVILNQGATLGKSLSVMQALQDALEKLLHQILDQSLIILLGTEEAITYTWSQVGLVKRETLLESLAGH